MKRIPKRDPKRSYYDLPTSEELADESNVLVVGYGLPYVVKRKPGPKPSANPKVKITVRVTPEEKRVILVYGKGSLTAGIRAMIWE